MARILSDENLPKKLAELVRATEICDSDGRVLGRFFPKLDPTKYNLEPQISREEMERRKNSNEKEYTTADVVAYLQKVK